MKFRDIPLPKKIMWGAVAIGVLALFSFVGLALSLPDGTTLKTKYPVVRPIPATNQFRIEWSGTKPAPWVALDEISKHARNAVMISEDWAFYDHNGLDENQILEVLEDSFKRKRFRGASTISQQVAKNLFLSSERTIWRKFREVLLTFQLEAHCSKDRILETYFNIAEWGEDLYGIRPAAQLYFHKSPSELTAREGAFLAMLLPSPIRYAKSFRERAITAYAQKMMSGILLKMLQAHFLTPEEYEAAGQEKFWFEEEFKTAKAHEGFSKTKAPPPPQASVAPASRRISSSGLPRATRPQSLLKPSKSPAGYERSLPGQNAAKPPLRSPSSQTSKPRPPEAPGLRQTRPVPAT